MKNCQKIRKGVPLKLLLIYHKVTTVSQLLVWNTHQIIWFCFIISLVLYVTNSFLARLCQYDNQTFSANQLIITSNCTKKCQYQHTNDTAITKCKHLFLINEELKCHPHSEKLMNLLMNLGHLLMITTATVHINVWPFIYGSNFTAHISND